MLMNLTNEIIMYILTYLDIYDLLKCKRITSKIKSIIEDEYFRNNIPNGILLSKSKLKLLGLIKSTCLLEDKPLDETFINCDKKYKLMAWVEWFKQNPTSLPNFNNTAMKVKVHLSTLDIVSIYVLLLKNDVSRYIDFMFLTNIIDNSYRSSTYSDHEYEYLKHRDILCQAAYYKLPLSIIETLLSKDESIADEECLINITSSALLSMDIDYIDEIFEYLKQNIDGSAINHVLCYSGIKNPWTLMNFVLKMIENTGDKLIGNIIYLYEQHINPNKVLLELLYNYLPYDYENKIINELEFVIKILFLIKE